MTDTATTSEYVEGFVAPNGKTVASAVEYDDGSKGVVYTDGTSEIVAADSSTEDVHGDTTAPADSPNEGETSFLLGNKFNPVVVLGDDPGNSATDVRDDSGAVIKKAQDNVLVAHYARVESVPRTDVSKEVAPSKGA